MKRATVWVWVVMTSCGAIGCPDEQVVDGVADQQTTEVDAGTPDVTAEIPTIDAGGQPDVNVALDANVDPGPPDAPGPVACLAAVPQYAQFGGKLCFKQATLDVQLVACGPTTVTGFELVTSPLTPELPISPDFAVVAPQGGPWSIAEGEHLDFQITYVPDGQDHWSPEGDLIEDVAGIAVTVDGQSEPLIVIPTSGFAVSISCPTAVIDVPGSGPHLVFAPIALDGSKSSVASCVPNPEAVSAYQWSATGPLGASMSFDPGPDVVDPTFLVDMAGTYILRLKIWDQQNVESCIEAEYELTVTEP